MRPTTRMLQTAQIATATNHRIPCESCTAAIFMMRNVRCSSLCWQDQFEEYAHRRREHRQDFAETQRNTTLR